MNVGFYQDGEIVAEFGDEFTSGESAGPFDVNLYEGFETHLVLTDQIYYYSNFIGFTLKDPQGNVVFTQEAGVKLHQDTVYHSFCAGCQ